MVTVYQVPHSPFCIAATAILRCFHAPFRVINVSYATRKEVIELTKGAYYQVPVLVDDSNGERIIFESSSESQDVAEYLDNYYAGGRLFPERYDGLQCILIDHLEREVENVTFRLSDPAIIDSIPDVAERTLVIRHKERKFGLGCIQQWRQNRSELLRAAERVLLPYEKILAHNAFLLGPLPVYADFLLYGIMENLCFAGKEEIPRGIESICEWKDRLARYRF